MAFRLHCDRCGCFVKNVNPKELRNLDKVTFCGDCIKKEAQLEKFAVGLKGKYLREVDKIVKEAQEELKMKLAGLTEGGE